MEERVISVNASASAFTASYHKLVPPSTSAAVPHQQMYQSRRARKTSNETSTARSLLFTSKNSCSDVVLSSGKNDGADRNEKNAAEEKIRVDKFHTQEPVRSSKAKQRGNEPIVKTYSPPNVLYASYNCTASFPAKVADSVKDKSHERKLEKKKTEGNDGFSHLDIKQAVSELQLEKMQLQTQLKMHENECQLVEHDRLKRVGQIQ